MHCDIFSYNEFTLFGCELAIDWDLIEFTHKIKSFVSASHPAKHLILVLLNYIEAEIGIDGIFKMQIKILSNEY